MGGDCHVLASYFKIEYGCLYESRRSKRGKGRKEKLKSKIEALCKEKEDIQKKSEVLAKTNLELKRFVFGSYIIWAAKLVNTSLYERLNFAIESMRGERCICKLKQRVSFFCNFVDHFLLFLPKKD